MVFIYRLSLSFSPAPPGLSGPADGQPASEGRERSADPRHQQTLQIDGGGGRSHSLPPPPPPPFLLPLSLFPYIPPGAKERERGSGGVSYSHQHDGATQWRRHPPPPHPCEQLERTLCAFAFSLVIIIIIILNFNFCHREAPVAVCHGCSSSSKRSELHAAAVAAAASSWFTHFLNAHSTLATRGSLGLAAPN